MRTVLPVSPGEMLEEEFLKPLGLTKYRLAKDIGVPAQRIGEIVSGKRAVTANTDLRLCRYFGLSDGCWSRGQVAYDTAIAKEALKAELAGIQRCSLLAAQQMARIESRWNTSKGHRHVARPDHCGDTPNQRTNCSCIRQ